MDGHDLDLPLGQETYSFGLSLATGTVGFVHYYDMSQNSWFINNLSKGNGNASQMFQQIESAKSKNLTVNRLP